MHPSGLLIGLGAFLIIGLLHPVVIKAEYHLGTGVWWVFLVTGLSALTGSVFAANALLSALLGVTGFSLLWSIREVFEQAERVRKGWFPANPKRAEKNEPNP